jgi:hypothetical protein
MRSDARSDLVYAGVYRLLRLHLGKWFNEKVSPPKRRIVGCLAPLAPAAALMKTRYQIWRTETDAEIRAFVLDFAVRRQARTQEMPRVRVHFAVNREVV